MGHIYESLDIKTLDFGPLPSKEDWALRVRGKRKNGKHIVAPAKGMVEGYIDYLLDLRKRYEAMESELRYESYKLDDADLILVAYGYCARVSEEAVNEARAQGLKAGLLRLITLMPFPYQFIREKAREGRKFLVVEDSLGQMVDDVKMGVEGKSDVHLVDVTYRHMLSEDGMIMPGRVLQEIRRLL